MDEHPGISLEEFKELLQCTNNYGITKVMYIWASGSWNIIGRIEKKPFYNVQIIMESWRDSKWVIDEHSGISLERLKELL